MNLQQLETILNELREEHDNDKHLENHDIVFDTSGRFDLELLSVYESNGKIHFDIGRSYE